MIKQLFEDGNASLAYALIEEAAEEVKRRNLSGVQAMADTAEARAANRLN
jgi:hypothetical protein